MSVETMPRVEELIGSATNLLQSCPYRDVRDLQIRITGNGSLLISGLLHSFYRKQIAQELLRPFADSEGLRITNEAEVLDVFTDEVL